MRILGIDYGDSRIGVAISDPMGWTAQGLETIEWRYDLTKPVDRIAEIIKDYSVEKVIIGFPRNMNGTVGQRGEKTVEFINMLKDRTGIEVETWDERLTTVAAVRTMNEVGMKASKKKKVVDRIAAVLILQGYLDRIKK